MDLNKEDLINFREMNVVKPREKAIDKAVSDIVGKEIAVNDPRVIKLVTKWKKEKGDDSSQDNFLEDPKKIEELKKELL